MGRWRWSELDTGGLLPHRQLLGEGEPKTPLVSVHVGPSTKPIVQTVFVAQVPSKKASRVADFAGGRVRGLVVGKCVLDAGADLLRQVGGRVGGGELSPRPRQWCVRQWQAAVSCLPAAAQVAAVPLTGKVQPRKTMSGRGKSTAKHQLCENDKGEWLFFFFFFFFFLLLSLFFCDSIRSVLVSFAMYMTIHTWELGKSHGSIPRCFVLKGNSYVCCWLWLGGVWLGLRALEEGVGVGLRVQCALLIWSMKRVKVFFECKESVQCLEVAFLHNW